jgi:hypothetical protein
MKVGVSTLERAFQLARSGKVAAVDEIRRALRQEGYDPGQVAGPAIGKQLRDIIKAERQRQPPEHQTV